MAAITILYGDQAVSASLTGGSWTPQPLTNLQLPDINTVARSTNTLTTSTTFDADFATPGLPTIGGVVLGPTNIQRLGSPAATWRLRFYQNSGLSPVLLDTGQMSIPTIDPELPLYLSYVPTTVLTTAGYIRVDVTDTGNPDGYIEIGRFLVMPSWSPAANYSEDNSFSIEPITDMVESLGGQRFYWARAIKRRLSVSFPFLTTTEIFSNVLSISLKSGISNQVFVIPDTADSTYAERRNFLCTMARAPAIRQLLVDLGSTAFEFEEVL
jgi:hypothetical protein